MSSLTRSIGATTVLAKTPAAAPASASMRVRVDALSKYQLIDARCKRLDEKIGDRGLRRDD
eukprot:scaffold504_cov141-Skeletonema_menzelii.AAC.4